MKGLRELEREWSEDRKPEAEVRRQYGLVHQYSAYAAHILEVTSFNITGKSSHLTWSIQMFHMVQESGEMTVSCCRM